MNATHTPGPWYATPLAEGTMWGVVADMGGPGKTFLTVTMLDHVGPDEAANEANARLMAASPDLLKACEAARCLYDHLALGPLEAACKYGDNYEPPTDADMLKVRGDLENSILKAKGGQP